MALSNKSIPVRRACLDCIISIVQQLSHQYYCLLYVSLLRICSVEISPLVLNEQLETLFELLNSCVFSSVTIQSILHMKVTYKINMITELASNQ